MEKVIKLNTFNEILEVLEVFSDSLNSLSAGRTVRENFAKKFLDNGIVLALKNSDEIVGFIAFYSNDSVKKISYISMIAVSPEHKRKGYGTKLIEAAVKSSREKNMKYIRLEVNKNNINAISFYKYFGFIFLSEQTENTCYMELEL